MIFRGCAALVILVFTTMLLSSYVHTQMHLLDESRHVVIVAVSQLPNGSYVGVSADLYVRVTCPGSGHVYVETLPLTQIDLQASTRIAALVASSIANVSFYACDFYASIKSDTPIVGGPSASGVTAIAFASALLRIPINESVVMTGMILPDGSVGPVGGLKYKLEAAASRGAKIFLVPYGQTRDIVYRIVSQRVGPSIITRVVPETIDLVLYGAQLNVQVIPVANIFEAIEIFTDGRYRIALKDVGYSERLNTMLATLNDVLYSWMLNISSEVEKVLSESRLVEDRVLSSIRGYTGIYVRNILQSIDSSISSLKNQAETMARTGRLYTASSLYFQTLIHAYNRLYILKIIEDEAFISNEINTITSSAYRIIESVHRYYLENAVNVNLLSIAINILDRVYEALIYANKTLKQQYIDAVSQHLAFASARMYTAKLWSTLLDRYKNFNSTIPRHDLDRLALYISALSQNIYTYIVAFSSSAQLPEDILSEAVDRYSLLLKASNPLDKLALGVSSISYMHLVLVSLFLQDYNSAIEALNNTIYVVLSQLSTQNILPIDVPLHIEMARTFESNTQTQLVMLSRLSIVLSIYRLLGIELVQPQPTSVRDIEMEHDRGATTRTVIITTTITIPHKTETVYITVTPTIQGIHIDLINLVLVIAAILILMTVILIVIRKGS